MGAEVQRRVGREVVAQVPVEGGEGVGRGEALLEQEPHRVALVAEGRLDADEDIAEALAEDLDRGPVCLVATGSGPPLAFDLGEMRLAISAVKQMYPLMRSPWELAQFCKRARSG